VTDPLVVRTRQVLDELQAWQELVGEVAEALRFRTVADRLDWLVAQPVLPPSPLEQLMFAQQGLALTTLQRVRTPRVAPQSVEKPPKAPARMGRPPKEYQFTDAQLRIAERALNNQAAQATTKGEAAA
jgi:hypothetical protein